ncbi:hypothetical protein CK203_114518 [Vitis vinifera]|uniref:Uncharacterized protein n=1 Tax=Vitis vinifera TaxID=29760 RepID=A0A438FDK6_VITVI|nr:hypothetical protein CK203_114518 [Vitis vinifera]
MTLSSTSSEKVEVKVDRRPYRLFTILRVETKSLLSTGFDILGPEVPTIPSSDGRVPSNPPQRQYKTWRPLTSPLPESSVHRTPTKRVRTSGPRESSRHSQPNPRAPFNSQRSSGMSPEAIIKRPMVIAPSIQGNSYCRARPFHFELYFDLEVMRQQSELRDSFGLLQRHIAEALHIPYEPVDLADFREWSLVSQLDMVHILSRGTSEDSVLLRKKLPLGILLVDVLLQSNLFLFSI